MKLKLLGKKKGMTQRFDEAGNVVVCTVIEAEPNVVTQIKTKDIDGYDALQIGFEKFKVKNPETVKKRLSKAMQGHFKKNNIEPRRHLAEVRAEDTASYSLGQELSVTLFNEVPYVDVTAVSKGKGYQGVMKRYNFAGGPAAHGSGFHRHGGSTGMRSSPGRTLPGQKKAGHMGAEKVTVQNLKIVFIDEQKQLLLVEGALPGPKGGLVSITPAMKKLNRKGAKGGKA